MYLCFIQNQQNASFSFYLAYMLWKQFYNFFLKSFVFINSPLMSKGITHTQNGSNRGMVQINTSKRPHTATTEAESATGSSLSHWSPHRLRVRFKTTSTFIDLHTHTHPSILFLFYLNSLCCSYGFSNATCYVGAGCQSFLASSSPPLFNRPTNQQHPMKKSRNFKRINNIKAELRL